MALLALQLPVFIASPSDLAPERAVLRDVVDIAVGNAARHRLLLHLVGWEDLPPGFGRPQALINRELRRAELIIVVLWSRIGTPAAGPGSDPGTVEELKVAIDQVTQGRADDVFVYFKTDGAPNGIHGAQQEAVARLRNDVERKQELLFATFASLEQWRERIQSDLTRWVEKWQGVPEICEWALEESRPFTVPGAWKGESRLHALRVTFDPTDAPALCIPLGAAAVEAYQQYATQGLGEVLPAGVVKAVKDAERGTKRQWILRGRGGPRLIDIESQDFTSRPLVEHEESVYFADSEWFHYFCAIGLVNAIAAGNIDAIWKRPYTNRVHQYLRMLGNAPEMRDRLIGQLRHWLRGRNDGTRGLPVVRDFSAYVLGMLNAASAQDDLGEAASEDESELVRLYSVAALGKMRARSQLRLLKTRFGDEKDKPTQLAISQAICRIVGVANYEL